MSIHMTRGRATGCPRKAGMTGLKVEAGFGIFNAAVVLMKGIK
jgi:hypothetical protein